MPPHLLINVYQHIAKVTNTRWNRAYSPLIRRFPPGSTGS